MILVAVDKRENVYVMEKKFIGEEGREDSDVVLLKYSSEGDLIWVSTEGTTGNDAGSGGNTLSSRVSIALKI